MREQLLDIIKHTSGLGVVEAVRVTGTDESTVFEAIDDDRTIIIRAELKKPIPELKGEFGIRNLGILQGLLNFSSFKSDAATVEVKTKTNNGESVPESVTFTSEDKSAISNFRFMSASLLPAQPQLKVSKWDVSVTPSDSKIQEFAALASLYSSIEQFFSASTSDKELKFTIGDAAGSNHSAGMTFADSVKGDINTTMFWPVNHVLTVLKIGKTEKPSLDIMNLGALRITLESEHANYSMIFPARKK